MHCDESACRVPLSRGCQLANMSINYQHCDSIIYLSKCFERLVMIYATVTCFTLCAIKSWCAAAVESAHSVCAGPVVLTGMTCTVIDTCVRKTTDYVLLYLTEPGI